MELILGNCLEKLKELEDNSVDAIVTDPPYGLSFMGKKWDYDVPSIDIWKECLRVLKPGGYLLAFAGTRTQHRMAVNIEDAGFEIRDMIAWVYGSGFPKSLNIGKAVDKIAPRLNQFDEFAKHLTNQIQISGKTQKEIASLFPSKTGGLTGCVWNWANGANVPTVAQWNILKPLLNLSDEFMPLIERIEREREVVGKTTVSGEEGTAGGYQNGIASLRGSDVSTQREIDITKGTSQWEGWGTALKPALEPITVARKPLEKGLNVAQNCLKWGVGGINIDGSRVGTEVITNNVNDFSNQHGNQFGNGKSIKKLGENKVVGRFPANLIHDGSEEVVGLFPQTKSGAMNSIAKGSQYNTYGKMYERRVINQASEGSAARFFMSCKYTPSERKEVVGENGEPKRFLYCSKASKRERNIGCEGLEEKEQPHSTSMKCAVCGLPILSGTGNSCKCKEKVEIRNKVQNFHPTVKPIALMEYLVRLVSREGQVVLDPFMGSGTTGMACKKLGREFIGIEMMPEYLEIAKCRIEGVKKDEQLGLI